MRCVLSLHIKKNKNKWILYENKATNNPRNKKSQSLFLMILAYQFGQFYGLHNLSK